jgi:nucleosome assembly protein 1-like 1
LQTNELDEEEEKEYRALELKYDKLYQDVYEQRKKLLDGVVDPYPEMLTEYEARATELNDEDYKKVEVTACDVKEIQNTPKGVPGFWLRAILNHPGIARLV